MPIVSFDDADTEHFYKTGKSRKGIGWSGVTTIVARKLDMLHYAAELLDLSSPTGNHLKSLSGKLAGLYSIRFNN